MYVTKSLKCVEVKGTQIVDGSFPRRIRKKDSSSYSLSSAYSSTGNFSIIKSHQTLHISDVLGQLRDRPFNLKGGGVMVFCFVQNCFFGQHES